MRDTMLFGIAGQDLNFVGDAVAVPFIFVITGKSDIEGHPFLNHGFDKRSHYFRPPFLSLKKEVRRASYIAAIFPSFL